MSFYAWPSVFHCTRFEMRLLPNTRIFTSPYSLATQTLDLLGERLTISLDLAPTSNPVHGAAREAYFNRLKASANGISIGHQRLKAPQGTLRGAVAATWKNSSGATATWKNSSGATATWMAGNPIVAFDIPQLANTGYIRTLPGATLMAGDWIGLGGQLVQIMTNATADGTGLMAIEFQGRARALIPAGTQIFWDAPTSNFILKPGTPNVPTSWTPGMVDGATIELIEVF